MSLVSETTAASPAAVLERYSERLSFETDCSDVYHAMRAGDADFVLVDVRGPKLFAEKHVPGAINLPHGKMTASKLEAWPQETLFVVYCAGPHCNGTDRAALRLARLGRRVKVMIGGVTGWEDEGLPFVSGEEPGSVNADAAMRA
jgi:rhodanese-related sulfurtransferase